METTDKSLKDKAIKFKGKDYVQVKDRILYLADNYEGQYCIETSYNYFAEEKMRVVRATLTIGTSRFTGLAQEIEGSTFVNETSALENAETSAVGRACAMAGIWVLDGIASIDELNKAENRQKTQQSKPVFGYKELENLKAKKDQYTWDTAIKEVKKHYTLDAKMEQEIMDLYGVTASDLF